MQIETLKEKIQLGLSQRQIAKEENVSQATVKHYLSKFNLKTKRKKFNSGSRNRKCSFCGDVNEKNFYKSKTSRCKKCHNRDCVDRAKDNKKYAIDKLGGKCSNCNYDKCEMALEIHHLDPKIKDHNFAHKGSWSKSRIDKELLTCVLLCANCHREEHYKMNREQ